MCEWAQQPGALLGLQERKMAGKQLQGADPPSSQDTQFHKAIFYESCFTLEIW